MKYQEIELFLPQIYSETYDCFLYIAVLSEGKGSGSNSIVSCCLFILHMELSQSEYILVQYIQ